MVKHFVGGWNLKLKMSQFSLIQFTDSNLIETHLCLSQVPRFPRPLPRGRDAVIEVLNSFLLNSSLLKSQDHSASTCLTFSRFLL